MGAAYQRRGKRSWLVTVHSGGQRERKTVHSEQDAVDLVRYIHKQELAGTNVIETIRQARATRAVQPPVMPEYPRLRDALPSWVDRRERSGSIRGSTAKAYRSRLATWVYPFQLPDGRLLGDLPVNQVTREMLGAVILRVKESGRSLAIVEAIRNPLRGYYAELIETKTLTGQLNPAADLKFFIGKGVHRKRRSAVFFAQEEGPQLVGTVKALFPRWHGFVLTGLLAGLRWGESAALYKTDIDWRRGRIHVQRTFSEKSNKVEPFCKDGEDRWVKASPALLATLREHIDAIDLEGQVKGWTPEQRQLVFPNRVGRITHHGHFIWSVWQPLLAKAGLPYRRYHATRHTYATWLLSDGADLRWVQQQMGHATIGQTADTYGHVQPDRHEEAASGLDRYLSV